MSESKFTDRERIFLIRAAAAFSDHCEPPELTPECPFYELTDQGPLCAEQCRDLIGEHASDLPSREAYSLGGVLAAQRRPKPRRGPRADQPAFDAAQLRIEDAEKALPTRRLAALTSHLKNFLLEPVRDDEAIEEVEEVLAEIGRRGIDTGALIRHGFERQVRLGVVALFLFARPELEDLASSWRTAMQLGESMPGDTAEVSAETLQQVFSPRSFARLSHWIRTAPISHLLRRTPPAPLSDLDLVDLEATAPPGTEAIIARWMVDRFSETYLNAWATDSLRLEWQYVHALRPGCTSAASMRERPADREALASELADQSVSQWEHGNEGGHAESVLRLEVAQFLSVALRALREGRRQDAVGLYRGFSEIDPENAEIQNNLGFCLLPDDPEAAIEHLLIAAADDDFYGQAASYANLALAFLLTDRLEDAFAALDNARDLADSTDVVWMWPIEPPRDRPTEQIALEEYLEALDQAIVMKVLE